MKFQSQYIPYSTTGKFTKIVLDYINGSEALRPFYEHPVSLDGIKSAIAQRKEFATNRQLLVEQFATQYKNFQDCDAIQTNIHALLDENTFTICTAHQPNVFIGHLYFVYKILHTIKLADTLKKELPGHHFVPVFFMGSEDADLEELNHVVIDGEKYQWETKQTGAVGRMKVDAPLIQLIEKIAGRVSVEKYGDAIIDLLKKCFTKNATVEQATFLLIHHLFKEFGLLVLLPDNPAFKREMISVFEDDIFNHTSSEVVLKTSEEVSKTYKAQAYPREINLFYLKDDLRSRIIEVGNRFVIHGTDIVFSKEEIKEELKEHPERFSPNVILRGLFQEIILPDVAWIGGGGELAYWLQLKGLFKNYQVPYPMLVLRNSFMIVDKKEQSLLQKLHLDAADLFKGKAAILNDRVHKESRFALDLSNEKSEFENIYQQIKTLVKQIDPTLEAHTSALETRHIRALASLEKKMFRAEKRKFADQKKQLENLFSSLFPNDGLQERTENFMLFYSRYGHTFFNCLYENSLTLEQQFCIMSYGTVLSH